LHGIEPTVLGDDLEGEARSVAEAMVARITSVPKPVVLISGGETTVTVTCPEPGRGGRNTEFLLALTLALKDRAGVWALAADTDGEDGANLGAAGAMAGPDTLQRARAAGLDPMTSLSTHDSGSFFAALGDLVVTGPTLTNVNDFRAILILPKDFDVHSAGA
jgi:hydroxypyruvate reductase